MTIKEIEHIINRPARTPELSNSTGKKCVTMDLYQMIHLV